MIDRTYRCDGPDCERTWRGKAQKELGMPVITNVGLTLHFCGWDCVLRYAGQKEPETIVPMGGLEDG